VTIDKSGVTVTIDSGNQSVKSLADDDPLSITGGSLTVTANSTIVNGLVMTGGSLTANGTGVKLTVTGPTTINSATLHAQNAATLNLAQLTSIDGDNIYADGGGAVSLLGVTSVSGPNGYGLSIQASGTSGPNGTGTPSTIDLSHVTTISGGQNNAYLAFNAYSGGKVDLSNVASDPTGRTLFQASGTGSAIDLSSLPRIISDQGATSLLSVTGGAAVLAPLLATLVHTDLTLDGTDGFAEGQLTSLNNATITVNGGTRHFTELASIDGNNVAANGGAVVSFPNVKSISGPNGYGLSIQASGTSGPNGTGTPSRIDLSQVTTLNGGQNNAYLAFNAYSGGEVDLSKVASDPAGRTLFQASGTGSVINLLSLPKLISDQGATSLLSVTGGAAVHAPLLTSLIHTDLTMDGIGGFPEGQIAVFTNATITVNSGTRKFTGLDTIDGDPLFAYGGAIVSFPDVTSISGPVGYGLNIQASGTSGPNGTGNPSTIDLSHVTTLGGAQNNGYLAVNAYSGGKVDLSAVTSNPSGRTFFQVSGTGSLIDLSALPKIASDQGYTSLLSVTSGGSVKAPILTTLLHTDLTLDGTGGLNEGQLISLTSATITVNSGTRNFTGLDTIDGNPLFAYGGAMVSFPDVTSISSGPNSGGLPIQASGTSGPNGSGNPSTIDLSHVTTLVGAQNNGYLAINAYSGGKVDLSSLSSNPSGRTFFQVSGTGSLIDLSALPKITSDQGYASLLSATGGGSVRAPILTTLLHTDLTLDGTGGLNEGQLTSLTSATITVNSGIRNFTGLRTIDGNQLFASGGAIVSFPDVTLISGPVDYGLNIQASGTSGPNGAGNPSTIDLSHVTTLVGAQNNGYLAINAYSGGRVDLSNVNSNPSGRTLFQASGTGSLIDLSALPKITSDQGYASLLSATGGGSVFDPKLATLSNVSVTMDATATFLLPPGGSFSSVGGANTVQIGTLINQGNLSVQSNATLNIQGGLSLDGSGVLTTSRASTLAITGDLLGTTQNADDCTPLGTVLLTSGTGTSKPPQQLEAMSEDVGPVQSGFTKNFAYGTLTLSSNTSVELVDQSANTSSGSPESVYVNELIVPAGATLNLNNLHLYVRGDQISGTIVGGTVAIVPSGGSISLNTPIPGTLTPAGATDDWTFYGTANESITAQFNPGSSGAYPALPPFLNWGQVTLLDASGNSLASATSASSGAIASISDFILPANGIYTIEVQAPSAHVSSTGNYVLGVFNVTPNVAPLPINQQETGEIGGAYGVDQYDFTCSAGQQVKLDMINSSGGVEFDFTGPGGYTAFTNLSSSSGLITLPSTGSYILTAHGDGASGGAYAFELQQTSVTSLTLGTPYTGTLSGSGQAQLFTVNVPTTQSLVVSLQDSSTGDVNEVYAKLGSAPTRGTYDYKFSNGTTASPQLLAPSAAPGVWYILVYSASVHSASAYTLSATGVQMQLTDITPNHSATGSSATVTLSGSGFDNTTSVTLLPMTGTGYTATSVSFDSFTQLTATFDLSTVPQGVYSIVATRSGAQSAELSGAFTVTPPAPAHLETHLILPAAMGFHIASTIYVEYSNTGGVAMPAPMLLLESSQPENKPLFTLNPALRVSGFWTSAIPQGYANTVQILATGKVPGVLEPGESVTVPVYYAGMQTPFSHDPVLNFDLRVYTPDDATPVDWSSLQSSLQPPDITIQAWSAIYSGLTSQMGNTWGGYVQLLDSVASYLGRQGETVTDVSQLWSFAVMQADGLLPTPLLDGATDLSVVVPGSLSLDFSRVYQEPIDARDTSGPFGYGWRDSWQYSLAVASDGTVLVTMPSGAKRVFQPDSRSSDYFDQQGDHGTLIQGTGGSFTLQESDGQIEQFNADGTLNFIHDTDGNRIAAGYIAGSLTTLTSNSGASLTIAYNAAGLIASVTASDGRAVHYVYDAGGHLTSVQSYDGEVTHFTYDSGTNPAVVNALTSIVNSDGTSQSFAYDAFGRLTQTAQTGGSDPLTYSYAAGEVTTTDAAGNASQFFFNEQGLIVKTIDPLGNPSFSTFDGNFNLTSVTGPTGLMSKYIYDANGNLISSTNPLGQTTTFTYAGQDNLLSGYTDANGHSTSYQYNASADLTSTKYADNTVESVTYDALGDPLALTNPNGQVVKYTYNAASQVTGMTLADGSKATYAYDSHGNMITASDASGVTTLTYDAGDRLTSVAYPNGLSIDYTYDASGRRTQMVEKSGSTITNTVNYAYNTLGQLAKLTDGTGALVIAYTYNNLGQLIREDKGDGTSTKYQYDADGNVLHLINFAADGTTVDSRFDYTYNTLREETSEATIDGTWTYSYDTTGQLIHAVFASTNPAIPSQDLAYIYDAVGNRTQTITNGATANYTSNSVNEYTSTGDTTYKYDADGNVISQTDASGTTTYSYDSLNRLAGVTTPTDTWIYEYDALGNRVATIHNGQETDNLVDPVGLGNVVGQYTVSGSRIASYTYGLGLVSQILPSVALYYDFDLLGSTAGLTSATGGSVASYSYLPFGGLLSSIGTISNPFTFVGALGITDDGSELIDMRDRNYDAAIGQFVSNDPLGLNGREANLREYAANNGTSFVDPTGLIYMPTVSLMPNPLNAPNPLFDPGSFQSPPSGSPDSGDFVKPKWIPLLDDPPPQSQFDNNPARDLPNPTIPYAPIPDQQQYDPRFFDPRYIDLFKDDFVAYEYELELRPGPPPGDPGGGGGAGGGSGGAVSRDPNSLLGPAGCGTSNFIASGTPLSYQINFENDPKATAPAQQVVIKNTLDPNLDLSTFQFTAIAFGDTLLTIPSGSQYYQTTVPITNNGETFNVLVQASLDLITRQVTVTFQSIDPTTELPPDVLAGFLPPENGTGRGEGYVSYTVSPKAGLPTGTQIRDVANITFDINSAIATDQVNDEDQSQGIDPNKQALVTIDANVPTSSVDPLPASESGNSFTVSWSGNDGSGSGIASYSVYVSEDGGPFDPFQTSTTDTSATFTGQPGHTYSFFSIATSNVRITQPTPTIAQATTQILATPPPPQPATPELAAANDSGAKGDNITDDATPAFSGATEAGAAVQLLSGTNVVGTATADSSGIYAITVQSPLSPGPFELTIVAANSGGSSPASNPFALTIVAPPATPSAPTLLSTESNGSASGETTTSISPHLVGTTLPGATVRLLVAGGTVVHTTKANSSGSYEIQVPGPLGVGAHTYQVDVIDQYGDVSGPSPAQTITVVNPPPPPPAPLPPLVTVTKFVEKTNKKHQVTEVDVIFSGEVNSLAANSLAGYRLATPGKKNSYTAKNAGIIKLKKAVFTASNNTVALTPKKPFALTKPVQILVYGTGPTALQDSTGRAIDGDHNGTPGGNAIVIIAKKGATIAAVTTARTSKKPVMTLAIDALFTRGELHGLRRLRSHARPE
jgi:RHS repeat-associated protein